MSETHEHKHTPGPWSVTERKPSHDCYGRDAIECLVHVGERRNTGNALAVVGLGGMGAISALPEHVRANASLIAAAPELLEALVEFPREHDYPSSEEYRGACYKWWEVYARPAIARAAGTGKEGAR